MITLTQLKYEIRLLKNKYKTSKKKFKDYNNQKTEINWEYMKEYENNIRLLNKLIEKYKK